MLCVLCPPSVSICGMNEDMMTEQERTLTAPEAGQEGRGRGVFQVHTLGCQMNVHDSERIAGVLKRQGYVPATEEQELDHDVDLIVMNTCAVRENAAERMYGTIGLWAQMKRERPNLQIAVGGCMAQLDRERIAEKAPWVDAVFGTKNIEDLPALLDQARRKGRAQVRVKESLDQFPSQLPAVRGSRISSWVAISVGCNNTCTFCIVPTTRGKERDRRPGDVLAEVRRCVDEGAKEVTLLGQNVNSYGRDLEGDWDFPRLLKAAAELPGDFLLRFMTSHPKDATEKLFDVMANRGKVAPVIHLPFQSGSSRVLSAMNRRYTREQYLDKVAALRQRIPDVVLTSDVIVGFPGETTAEFEETLSLIEEVRFDALFTFIYSPRKGTPAAELPDPMSKEEKSANFDRLVEAQNRISLEKHRAYIGTVQRCLIDGAGDDPRHSLTARTAGGRLVHLDGDGALIGQYADIRITDCSTWALFGELA